MVAAFVVAVASANRSRGDWDTVFWGVPTKGQLGRYPTAVRVASELNAHRITWLIGSARLDSGETEAEWMRAYVLSRSRYDDLLRDFPESFGGEHFRTAEGFISWLREISIFEADGHNTATDLEFAARHVDEALTGEDGFLHVISSANHVQRVTRDALLAFEKPAVTSRMTIGAVAADTCYGGKSAADVVIYDRGEISKPNAACA